MKAEIILKDGWELWQFLEDSWSATSYASKSSNLQKLRQRTSFWLGRETFWTSPKYHRGTKNHLPIRIRVKNALDLVLSSQLVFKILISNPPLPNNFDHNGLDYIIHSVFESKNQCASTKDHPRWAPASFKWSYRP